MKIRVARQRLIRQYWAKSMPNTAYEQARETQSAMVDYSRRVGWNANAVHTS
jgi:hypothetical protein